VLDELGIAFVPFSPLGRGFLAGQVTALDALPPDDLRRRIPRFQGDHFARNMVVFGAFAAMAAARRCTPAQLALAWVLAKGDDYVPIPGTKHVAYIEEDAGAADVSLSAEDVARLEEIFAPEAVSGDRYPPELARLVDRAG
jgi:aryl-alcohol dehydrogenase-like predicted oxidoreductase